MPMQRKRALPKPFSWQALLVRLGWDSGSPYRPRWGYARALAQVIDSMWWPETGSNRRRRPFQGRALPLSYLASENPRTLLPLTVVSESAASGGRPGQVSNCAQATNVSIAITSLCANCVHKYSPRRPAVRETHLSYTGRSPGFPVELVALTNLMRLSLMKAAHAAMDGATYRKSGRSLTSGRWTFPCALFCPVAPQFACPGL
jgi:hypothetical protein